MNAFFAKWIFSLTAASVAVFVSTGCQKEDAAARTPGSAYERMDNESMTNARTPAGRTDPTARAFADITNETLRDADNTARNIRDRVETTLTPGDQGQSAADREITQKVRTSLTGGNYSLIAKNIKIVTVDGKVTLRGPVTTEAEKTGIVGLARGIAGDASVDDQLEVKANP